MKNNDNEISYLLCGEILAIVCARWCADVVQRLNETIHVALLQGNAQLNRRVGRGRSVESEA